MPENLQIYYFFLYGELLFYLEMFYGKLLYGEMLLRRVVIC